MENSRSLFLDVTVGVACALLIVYGITIEYQYALYGLGILGCYLAVRTFRSLRALTFDGAAVLIVLFILSFGSDGGSFEFIPITICVLLIIWRIQTFRATGASSSGLKLGVIKGSRSVKQAARKALRNRELQEGTYTARWADAADLAQANMYIENDERFERNIALAAPSSGMLIGIKEGHANRQELPHFLVFGATRAGKGRLLTANSIMWPESLVVLDIKGENYQLTAGIRAQRSRIVVLHPNGLGHRYDPFMAMRGSDEGLRTAASIIIDSSQDKQPVFGQTAETALFAAFLGARLEDAPTLPYLQALLDEGVMGYVQHLASLNNKAVNRALTQALTVRPEEFTLEFFERSGLLRGAWGTLNTRCSTFMTDGIMSMMGGNDLQPKDLYDENISLYLIFPESETKATTKAFQIIMTSLINSLIQVSDERFFADQKPERQILWLLDEAGRTPIQGLDDYIATISGRGMTFGLFAQDIPQFTKNYGVAEQTVRSNSRVQVFYGPTEGKNIDYIEERLGQYSIVHKRPNSTVYVGGVPIQGDPEIVRESHRSLLTKAELYKMTLDDVIIFAPEIPPVYAPRIEPFQIFNDLHETPKAPPLTQLEPVDYTLSSAGAPPPPQASSNRETRPHTATRVSKAAQDVQVAAPETVDKSIKQDQIQKPSIPRRQTFINETDAATAALRDQGGDVARVVALRRGVSNGGTPYAVFTNGVLQVVICQVRDADCYYLAQQDEIELLEPRSDLEPAQEDYDDQAPALEPDLGFDDIDADLAAEPDTSNDPA